MTVKDNFSAQSADYSRYRPGYPDALFNFIFSHINERTIALDMATGNGQVAAILSSHFKEVIAIDISEKQILNSINKDNITYSVATAENTGLTGKQFDLITVGQAAHWFQLDKFYDEVKRIIKPGGVLALFGYQLFSIDAKTDAVIHDFYTAILGPYWDPERKLVDEGYEALFFPFEKITHPQFKMEYLWTLEQLTGFLGTWSAVYHYKNKMHANPLELISERLRSAWGDNSEKKVTFPVFLLMTRID